MEEVEDEDVVFEGSTLHQHLLDTGFTDFEPIQLSHSSVPPDNRRTDSTREEKTFFDTVKKKWLFLCAATTGGWLPETVVCVGVGECVAGTGLVSEEDWLLLEHFLPGGEELHHSGRSLHPPQPWIWLPTLTGLNNLRILLVSSVMVMVTVVIVMWETCCTLPGAFLLALPTTILLAHIYAFLCSYRLVHQIKKSVLLLKDFSHIISRCLRLLQEVDLIAKGFVLAQGSSNTSFSLEHETPQCSSLRDALRSSLTAVVHILVLNHRFLDHCTLQFPCTRHLCEDMPEISEGCSTTEHLLFLKKWVAVIKIQLSTVLTELLLYVHQKSGADHLYTACHHVFSSEQACLISNETKSLVRHYEYAKSYWFEDREEGRKKKSFEEKKKDVYIAVHSLNLHMQAALFRVHNLEKNFDEENLSSNHFDNVKIKHEYNSSYEYAKEQLDIIKRELDSCQGCLEEAEIRVDRKYGKNKVLPQLEHLNSASSNISEDISSTKKQKPVIVLSAMVDPIIEDEVFEAFIDQEYSDRLGDDYDDDFWNADVRRERQILKLQKEQGKRVLNELRPILVNRRRMWEKREMIALSRQHPHQPQPADKDQSLGGEKYKIRSSSRMQAVEGGDASLINNTQDHPQQDHVNQVVREETDLVNGSKASSTLAPHVLQNCECVEEVDSDEERLEVYRKMRKELDEDERSRLREEAEEETKIGLPFVGFNPFQSVVRATVTDSDDTASGLEDSEKEIECPKIKIPHPLNLKYSPNSISLNENGLNSEHLTTFVNNVEHQHNPNHILSALEFKDLTVNKPVERECNIAETSVNVSPVSDKADGKDDSEKEVPTTQEETFVHNDDVDETQQVDWNRFRLPPCQTDTLEERLELYSGGCGVGFHAEIAAQALAASRRFQLAANSSVETFDGVGEGEELSVSEDDEDGNIASD